MDDDVVTQADGADSAMPVLALVEADGTFREIGEGASRLLGLQPQDVLGTNALDRLDPRDVGPAASLLEAALGDPHGTHRLRVRARDGHGRWRSLDIAVDNRLDDPGVGAVVVRGTDVTEGWVGEIARRLESRLLQRLPAAVVVMDDSRVVMYWNERATTMYGYTAGEAIGRSLDDLGLGPEDPAREAEVVEAIRSSGRWEGEFDARRSDGSIIPIHATLEAVADDDIGFRGVVGAAVDISERRRLQSDLAFTALHDPLTGLANRRLFVDRLEAALARSARTEKAAAVLIIDLDRFKDVNDIAGHGAGDEVLCTVAAFLEGLARDGDFVGRFGGDEFVVGCEGLDDPTDALDLANQVLQVLRVPFRIGDREFAVSASIGVALASPGAHADTLIRNADGAMYAAKHAGRGRVEVYDDELHEVTRLRQRVATDLTIALDERQLEVHYQPEIRMATGTLAGFEALVRWRHPTRGIVPPDEFIAVAEQSGLICRLGHHVLVDACAALARWRQLAPEHEVTVAVNVSGRQLEDPAFPGQVARAVAEAGVPPGLLCLEVTESALHDSDTASRSLRALKAVGVLIAIDDFGTGYSSLSRLKRFPVDFLKIDRSFVGGLGRDPEDEVIVAAVVTLARSLGLEVVAEGVETADQLDRLAALGSDLGQGYHWSRAVPASEAEALVAERVTGWAAPLPLPVADGADGDPDAVPIDAKAAVGLLVHELTAPLTALAGFAELLTQTVDSAQREIATRAIERNARLARAALTLVSDVSALNDGTLRLELEPTPLAHVVADACALAEARPGGTVRFQIDVDDLEVEADPDRLVSAISNLLRNARKFAPEQSTVRIWTEVGDGAVTLHVADEGPGVPADRVGLIFRKFGRADRERSGSGLGLFLARGIARAHGGELSYRRSAGGGADFVLELPLATASD